MAVPFEALLPYGIIFGLITIAGGSMSVIHGIRNNGKRDRFGLDQWDRQLQERDYRLTGEFRKQRDTAVAPEAFKTNGWWKVSKWCNEGFRRVMGSYFSVDFAQCSVSWHCQYIAHCAV